ncbi:MAG TPA: histidine kinase dimerization/phospho-acceptor domain-containing protein, partial [Candidatus Kryptonia bacterium]|nr:histidine kinase dimerization/phospho-acceptor domain-containing protein [Candidatus Kryptonia bacterium]
MSFAHFQGAVRASKNRRHHCAVAFNRWRRSGFRRRCDLALRDGAARGMSHAALVETAGVRSFPTRWDPPLAEANALVSGTVRDARGVEVAMTALAESMPETRRIQTLLLLRWVLIIATSYLLLFSRPQHTAPSVGVFVAGYFASNLLLTRLLPRLGARHLVDIGIVLFDTVAICLGLALTGNITSDFFVLYFLVVFLAAMTERLALVVAAAVLASVVHLMTVTRFMEFSELVQNGYLLRIPFFFVVALFFGHLVEDETHARAHARLEFVLAVSHDLKSPVAVIQSIAELLLDGNAGSLNGDQADLVRRIHANARHLITLSHNLLNAARIEAGRLALQCAPENLSVLVEHAVTIARNASDLKNITL